VSLKFDARIEFRSPLSFLFDFLSVYHCCSSFLRTSYNSAAAEADNSALNQGIISGAHVASVGNHIGNGGRVVNGKYQPTEGELLHHEQVDKTQNSNNQFKSIKLLSYKNNLSL
jgi:hypothetical protein